MAAQCSRESDHELPRGQRYAQRGCKHPTAEGMSRADFVRLPLVRCTKCRTALGRVCPDCRRVY